MPPTEDPPSNVPANYVLDILGNVLFLQILRAKLADIPVGIMNVPEVNFKRIITFFHQIPPEFNSKIFSSEKPSAEEFRKLCNVILNYKTKSVVDTPFPDEFYSDEEILLQRLRESTTPELVVLQLNNFFAKVKRIRNLFSQNPLDVRQDPKKFHTIVQNDFRKAPVSREFVQFVVDTRNVGQFKLI